jgi:hypothetical protein
MIASRASSASSSREELAPEGARLTTEEVEKMKHTGEQMAEMLADLLEESRRTGHFAAYHRIADAQAAVVEAEQAVRDAQARLAQLLEYAEGEGWLRLNGRLLLTTQRAESSYGIPVLVVAGQAYGPSDTVPADEPLDYFVQPANQAVLCAAHRLGMREHPLVEAFVASPPVTA